MVALAKIRVGLHHVLACPVFNDGNSRWGQVDVECVFEQKSYCVFEPRKGFFDCYIVSRVDIIKSATRAFFLQHRKMFEQSSSLACIAIVAPGDANCRLQSQ